MCFLVSGNGLADGVDFERGRGRGVRSSGLCLLPSRVFPLGARHKPIPRRLPGIRQGKAGAVLFELRLADGEPGELSGDPGEEDKGLFPLVRHPEGKARDGRVEVFHPLARGGGRKPLDCGGGECFFVLRHFEPCHSRGNTGVTN